MNIKVFLTRLSVVILVAVLLPFLGGLIISFGEWSGYSDRRSRLTGSSNQAPKAEEFKDAIVQVYAARAARWRGVCGFHTWITYKKTNATHFIRTEVKGWNAKKNRPLIETRKGVPDKYWYGYTPKLLADLRGAQAEIAIAKIEQSVSLYQFKNLYTVWPGPNSNTFTAYIVRDIEELKLDMPAGAIGKDYLDYVGFAQSPSNTGFQFSALGLLGFTMAFEEGLELNILGAIYGIDLNPPALKLPCVGRLGF